MAATTKDIARECGVSLATVQRALHGTGRISEETKQRILDKAKELHYEPNLTARTLTLGKSRMLGVLIPFLNNMYFAKICDSMTKAAVKRGYILNILVHGDNKEREKEMLTMLKNYSVDGIVINPINKGETLRKILSAGRQQNCILALDEAEKAGFCGVGIDEQAAGAACAEYVLKRGYQEIYFIAPTYYDAAGEENPGHHSRFLGFREACRKQGNEPVLIVGEDYTEQISAIMRKRNAVGRPALVSSGAIFAVNVINRLFQDGMEPGREYGVMTFDVMPEMAVGGNVRVTCLDNHVEKIGEMAANAIIDLCEDIETPQRNVVPFSIIDGNTL